MKRLATAAAISLLLFLPLMGCQALEKGSGKLKIEDFNFNGFSNIEIEGPFEVDIAYADSYDVNITADDNLFTEMQIHEENDTLKISLRKSQYFGILKTRYIDATAKTAITMPQLRCLSIAEGAKATCSGFNSRASLSFTASGASSIELKNLSAGDVSFSVSDASKVTGNVTTGDVKIAISGGGIVQLDGTACNLACDVSHGSQLKLDILDVVNANVKLNSASTGTINLKGKLDVNLSGDSDLFYFGEPVMGNTMISGDSTMQKK